jgi:hypothetical protein
VTDEALGVGGGFDTAENGAEVADGGLDRGVETLRIDRGVLGGGGESRELFFTNCHSYILCEQAISRHSRLSACVVTLGQTGCPDEESDKESGKIGKPKPAKPVRSNC